jgi:hypothetical protein
MTGSPLPRYIRKLNYPISYMKCYYTIVVSEVVPNKQICKVEVFNTSCVFFCCR